MYFIKPMIYNPKCAVCFNRTSKANAKRRWYVIRTFHSFLFFKYSQDNWLCNDCQNGYT